jgi:hypothetical protein
MTQNHSCIIYLIGKPGTGKYTIAQELEKSGFIVCDNHLMNNPILTLLNHDGLSEVHKAAWSAIRHIRTAVLDFMSEEQNHNYVLTNCIYDNEGDRPWYTQVELMALKRNSLFIPVILHISEEEHLKRITQPARKAKLKSIDTKHVYYPEPLISIKHPHLLELDVTKLSAIQVAEKILKHMLTLIEKAE